MNIAPKSRGTAVLLAILLGPLGLLYASVVGGVILGIIAIATAPTVIGPIFCWFLSILVADHAAAKHNKAVSEFMSAVKSKE